MAALVIVKKQSLQVYFTDRDGPIVVPFTPEAISDLEIVSEQILEQSISKALGTTPVRPTVPTIIALTDELLFLQKLDPKAEADQTKTFLAAIPFSQVAIATLTLGENRALMATNQELYETIAHILTTHGYVTTLVAPWVAMTTLGIGAQGAVDRVTVKHIFDGMNTLRAAHFPLDTQEILAPTQDAKSPTKTNKKIPKWMIILGSVALLYLIAMYVFFLRP